LVHQESPAHREIREFKAILGHLERQGLKARQVFQALVVGMVAGVEGFTISSKRRQLAWYG
jgi:hypothetical protein